LKEEIRRLLPLLCLNEVEWRYGVRPYPETALCVVLARLSYPGRWTTCVELFERSASWLSTVFNDAVLFLYHRFKGLLEWHPLLTYSQLKGFAAAIEAQGGGERIWGFVDGTF
jgi:hypothetical protein